jgi:glutamyl-tRNA synthetase
VTAVPVGRLAPSPTGVLHLGNARSFLLAWLDLRSRGGTVLMRIEDLDGPRVRAGAAEQALEDLQWLGLDWDGEPLLQSSRADAHAVALQRLAARGSAYPCTCTRADIERAASAPHAGEEGPVYPGTCIGRWADAAEAEAVTGRAPAWRFRVPDEEVVVRDRVAGECRFRVAEELGDFVIRKRDGQAAYQLAVVVDDAATGVDSVLRGDDLLPSAARQQLLYRELEAVAPEWAHVPLVVGEDGRRLAKRHGDTSLKAYRDGGVPAETLVGWLAASAGLRDDATPCAAAELVSSFSLEGLPRAATVWRGYPCPADGC